MYYSKNQSPRFFARLSLFSLLLFCLLTLSACVFVVKKEQPLWLEGVVSNDSGQPLARASILWRDMQLYTNSEGCFFLGGVAPEETLNLQISHAAYQTVELKRAFGSYRVEIIMAAKGQDAPPRIRWEAASHENSPGCSS